MNIINYINRIDRNDISIHIPPGFMDNKAEIFNVILLISHALSRTGAPIQLMELAKALCELGYQPIVYSIYEGDLINNYMNLEIPVICGRGPAQSAEWVDELVRGIDLIFINSLTMAAFVRYLTRESIHVFWWIHESSFMFNKRHCVDIPVSPNLKILTASDKCRGHIAKYMSRDSSILNVCIEDHGVSEKKSTERISFLWAGSFDYNKAPEILLKAILQLPHSYHEKSDFFIVGQNNNKNEYTSLITEIASKVSNIHLLSPMDHDDFMNLMDEIDSVVVTSFEETMNTVAVEGLMKGKIVICSDGCGNTAYIKDNKTGFVFPIRDYNALSEKLRYIIDNHEKLDDLRLAGRMIYEQNFTYEIFKQNVHRLVTQ